MTLTAAKAHAVAHWPLDEASGTRTDSVGTNPLTDNNTVTSAAGVFGNAAEFVAANSEYLSHADNATLSAGDILFELRCWVKFTSFGTTRSVIVKGADLGAASTCEWGLYADGAGNLNWRVSDGGSFTNAIWGTALSTGVWYLVHCWHDPTANQIGIAVNAGTAVTTSYSAGLTDGTGSFKIGNDDATRLIDGLVDDVVILKGYVLDATERTADYNSGAGVAFADWDPTHGGISFLSGYAKRKAIKYKSVFPGSSLVKYPKLFSITTDANIAVEMTSNTGFAVTTANGTTTVPFGFYPETDLNTGTLLMRARFSISSSAAAGDVLGYIYYDHTATTTEDKPGVMDGNYVLFMPLEEDPSGSPPQMLDWVTNSNVGTSSGISTDTRVTAQVGKGLDFDGSDDKITASGSQFDVLGDLTIEAIVSADSFSTAYQGVLMLGDNVAQYGLVIQNSSTWYCPGVGGNLFAFFTGVNLSTSTLTGIAVKRSGSNAYAYINGSIAQSGSADSQQDRPNNLYVGSADPIAMNYWDGVLDEIRLSSTARSDDWLAYANQDDFHNSDTFTLGAEETGGGGGTAYTLSASAGSFTLTGQVATLLKSLHLANSPGSFTLTGKSATVSIGRPLSASAGSFVLTGRTATTSWPRSLSLSVGTFTVSGKSATFLTGKGLTGTSGSFVVTGQNTTLTSARSLSLSRGTFTLSGQSATPSVGRPLSATSGAFLLTGKTLTASIARIIAAGVGSFSVTGQSAQLVASNVILVSAIFRFDVQFARVQVHSPQFVYIQKFDVKFGSQ